MNTDAATVELSNTAAQIPEPEPPTEPDTQPRQLSQFLPEAPYGHNPVVRLCGDGRELVIVGRSDATAVEVCHDGRLSTCPAHLTAVVVADPGRCTDLLRQALTTSTRQRASMKTKLQAADADLQGLNADLQAAKADLRQADRDRGRVLDEVRQYAINAYRDDDFDLDVLNKFLEQLDLERYEPAVRVRFTISGSLDVSGAQDMSAVERDVENYLDLNASQVDDVLDGSFDYETTITDVEQVE